MRPDPSPWSAEPHLPIAQVVSTGKGPVRLKSETLRERMRERLRPIEPQARQFMTTVMGFWPLIAVGALAISLLWSAGLQEP